MSDDAPSLADLVRHVRNRTQAEEGDEFFTSRTISHDEARQAAQRLINSHFDQEPRARASIPADRDRDDDLVLCAYIKQRSALDVPWLAYDSISDVLTIHGCRISGRFLEQLTQSPCGISFRVISRNDGAVTVAQDVDPRALAAPALLRAAKEVMAHLEKYGPRGVPHLMDDDMNCGQRLRDAIAAAERSA